MLWKVWDNDLIGPDSVIDHYRNINPLKFALQLFLPDCPKPHKWTDRQLLLNYVFVALLDAKFKDPKYACAEGIRFRMMSHTVTCLKYLAYARTLVLWTSKRSPLRLMDLGLRQHGTTPPFALFAKSVRYFFCPERIFGRLASEPFGLLLCFLFLFRHCGKWIGSPQGWFWMD